MRTLGILAVMLAVFVLVVPAYCAEAKVPAAVPAKTETVKGKVTKIDLVKEILTVQMEKGMAEDIKIFKETEITKGGKKITKAEIIVDDKVKVTKKGEVIEKIEIEVIPVESAKTEGIPLTTKSGAPVTTKAGDAVTTIPAEKK